MSVGPQQMPEVATSSGSNLVKSSPPLNTPPATRSPQKSTSTTSSTTSRQPSASASHRDPGAVRGDDGHQFDPYDHPFVGPVRSKASRRGIILTTPDTTSSSSPSPRTIASESTSHYDPRKALWPMPSYKLKAMTQDRDGIYRSHDVPAVTNSPDWRIDLFQCYEFMANKSGKNYQGVGDRPMTADGSYDELKFWTRGEFLSECLLYGEGFRRNIDQICPLDQFPDMGMKPRREDGHGESIRVVGLSMHNRKEVPLLEMVAQLNGIVLVPLYDTLNVDDRTMIFDKTRMTTLIVDLQYCRLMLDAIDKCQAEGKEAKLPDQLIFTHGPDDGHEWEVLNGKSLMDRVEKLGSRVSILSEFKADSELEPQHRHIWHPEDLWTITYSSGTTGSPKGILLKHRTLMSITYDVTGVFCHDDGVLGKIEMGVPTYFSYLPFAHIFERTLLNSMLSIGTRVVFASTDRTKLMDEVKSAKTTTMVAVPRILESIHAKVLAKMNEKGFIIRTLFNQALASKVADITTTGHVKSPTWDALIMNKVKAEVVGPQLQSIICGGAPINSDIRNKVKAILSVPIVVGYGLTESCGAALVQHSRDSDNSIGWTLPSVEARLLANPELELDPAHGTGELLLRGNTIFSGYFRQPGLTDEILDDDGWLHTGDSARIDTSSGCTIIGRVKHNFKLAQGKYIAPDRIENILQGLNCVDQIVVTGTSTENYCVAFVSLADSFVKASGKPIQELLQDSGFQTNFIGDLRLHAAASGLVGYEQPRHVIFATRSLRESDGYHTPTLKLKRAVFDKKFRSTIDQVYQTNCNVVLDVDAFLSTT